MTTAGPAVTGLLPRLTGADIDRLLTALGPTTAALAAQGWTMCPVSDFHVWDLYVDYASATSPITIQVVLSGVDGTGALGGITVAIHGWAAPERAHFVAAHGFQPTDPAAVLRALHAALAVHAAAPNGGDTVKSTKVPGVYGFGDRGLKVTIT